MKWAKRGRVYVPTGELWWARTHALVPTADVLDARRVRVYFASLDEQKVGRVGYLEVDAADPTRVVHLSPAPVLDVGERGTFDDSGVNPSSILRLEGRAYLYYIGWQLGIGVPYMLFSGLAVSEDDGRTFTRHGRVPVLDRTSDEPFSRAAPFVIADGGTLRAWYWSCVGWRQDDAGTYYYNVINHAWSSDGIHWTDARTCLRPPLADDISVGRPWVIKEDGLFKMWYSIRARRRDRPYRMGYAESANGLDWHAVKDEEVGLEASDTGWDSEMVCFPCVVDVGERRLMFYNGNGYGLTGFGVADLIET